MPWGVTVRHLQRCACRDLNSTKVLGRGDQWRACQLTLKISDTANATSNMPECRARNDSSGVSAFLRSSVVSATYSKTFGKKTIGTASINSLSRHKV